jgi:alkanesulfonate monooxygenase SsuD/methylene tetrahydromethanopterin reductase-like flavin-dependent oxidoreductase (luciferase family)
MSLTSIDPTCRRGLAFTPMETDRRVLVEAAVLADRLGYETIAVPEGWSFDAGIVLAEIATRTESIRLASGVFSVWGRSAATLAMAAATLDDLSGGRFSIGLGASTAVLAERFHQVPFARPSLRLRRVATDVRALLDGERVTGPAGERGIVLGYRPERRIPMSIGALGPRSVRVATDLADGWSPALLPRDRADAARHQAIQTAGPADPELLAGPMASPADPEHPQQAAEQLIGWYLTGMGPFYGDMVAGHGFGAEVAALRAANPSPRPGRIEWPADADRLLDQLAVHGDAGQIGGQMAAWDQLADVVTLRIGPGPLESVLAMVEAAAPPLAGVAGPSSGPTRRIPKGTDAAVAPVA